MNERDFMYEAMEAMNRIMWGPTYVSPLPFDPATIPAYEARAARLRVKYDREVEANNAPDVVHIKRYDDEQDEADTYGDWVKYDDVKRILKAHGLRMAEVIKKPETAKDLAIEAHRDRASKVNRERRNTVHKAELAAKTADELGAC